MANVPSWFPCHAIEFDAPLSDAPALIESFLGYRPSANWLLMAFDAAASERHLWSAWVAMTRAFAEGTNTSRNADAEFLRLLSGTHQIRIGFERAGLRSGDNCAWLVRLPHAEHATELPATDWNEFTSAGLEIMRRLGAELMTRRPEPTEAGVLRLGIEITDSNNQAGEDMFISHIINSQLST